VVLAELISFRTFKNAFEMASATYWQLLNHRGSMLSPDGPTRRLAVPASLDPGIGAAPLLTGYRPICWPFIAPDLSCHENT
jgi:hypothetical protein